MHKAPPPAENHTHLHTHIAYWCARGRKQGGAAVEAAKSISWYTSADYHWLNVQVLRSAVLVVRVASHLWTVWFSTGKTRNIINSEHLSGCPLLDRKHAVITTVRWLDVHFWYIDYMLWKNSWQSIYSLFNVKISVI